MKALNVCKVFYANFFLFYSLHLLRVIVLLCVVSKLNWKFFGLRVGFANVGN